MMSEISQREYEIQMEEWNAMETPRLEPGAGAQGSENIAIIDHQSLNNQVENSEVVVMPRLTFFEKLWQAIKWLFGCFCPQRRSI